MKHSIFGNRVSELRNKKGMTQKELAQACNVDIRTIQRIEAGEVLPRMYTIKLLAKALDVQINELKSKVESTPADITLQLRWSFIAAVVFSINYIPVIFQIITKPFDPYVHELGIVIHIISCIFFFRGFYLLAKQSNNTILSTSVLLSMVLLPLLNIMDLLKEYFFRWDTFSTVFTVVCINAFILGIGFLLESKTKANGNNLYKIAGITTLVQTGFFFSPNPNFIATGLIISAFCNVVMTYILYSEMTQAKKQLWGSGISPA